MPGNCLLNVFVLRYRTLTGRKTMSTLGAVSSYALAVRQMQMSVIKADINMQKQAVDILLNGDSERSVPVSENLGQNLDISI